MHFSTHFSELHGSPLAARCNFSAHDARTPGNERRLQRKMSVTRIANSITLLPTFIEIMKPPACFKLNVPSDKRYRTQYSVLILNFKLIHTETLLKIYIASMLIYSSIFKSSLFCKPQGLYKGIFRIPLRENKGIVSIRRKLGWAKFNLKMRH